MEVLLEEGTFGPANDCAVMMKRYEWRAGRIGEIGILDMFDIMDIVLPFMEKW